MIHSKVRSILHPSSVKQLVSCTTSPFCDICKQTSLICNNFHPKTSYPKASIHQPSPRQQRQRAHSLLVAESGKEDLDTSLSACSYRLLFRQLRSRRFNNVAWPSKLECSVAVRRRACRNLKKGDKSNENVLLPYIANNKESPLPASV